MFHVFKSLLLSAGYSEKSHECLIIGVEELFIHKGILPSSIIASIRDAKNARESADYGLTYGRESADGTIQDAELIYQVVSEYLLKTGYKVSIL